MEGSQALTSMDTKSPKVLNLIHGRAPPLFIPQRPNRAVAQNIATGASDSGSGTKVRTMNSRVLRMDPHHVPLTV